MKKLEFLSKNSAQTKKIAGILAVEIKKPISQKRNKAAIIGIMGDLGSGKTTFVQGFADGLGVKEKITSPTFVIMKKIYLHPHRLEKSYFSNFYHFDFYRLKSKKDLILLEMENILNNPKNLVIVEWPNKIKYFMSALSIKIHIDYFKKKERIVKIIFK